MKNFIFQLFAILLTFSLSGCGLVEDVFKAGLIFALIIIFVIGLIIYLLRIIMKQINKPAIVKIQ